MSNVLVLSWKLRIPGCRSLKEKRMTVRSLKDRLRHHFHVAVAETGLQDVHDQAELTVALVGSDGGVAESLADRVNEFILENGRAVVISATRERM